MAPAELRVRPAGKLPEVIDQVYGGTPPEAASEALVSANDAAGADGEARRRRARCKRPGEGALTPSRGQRGGIRNDDYGGRKRGRGDDQWSYRNWRFAGTAGEGESAREYANTERRALFNPVINVLMAQIVVKGVRMAQSQSYRRRGEILRLTERAVVAAALW